MSKALLTVFLGLVCLYLALVDLGSSFWRIELLAHFRLYPAGTVLILGTILFWIRKPRIIAFWFVTLLWLWLPLLPFLKWNDRGQNHDLKVMSYNLGHSIPGKNGFISYLEKEKPDILLILELDTKWNRALAAHPDYQSLFCEPRSGAFGIGVFAHRQSGISVLESELIQWPDSPHTPGLKLRLKWKDGVFTFFGVHPPPPIRPEFAKALRGVFKQIPRELEKVEGPVILAGDFNATPWSRSFRTLVKTAPLNLGQKGFGTTWSLFGIGIPIDHILTSNHWVTNEWQVGPNFGSDHRPIWGTILHLR